MKKLKNAVMFLILMGAGHVCFGAGAVFEQPISTQAVAGCRAISNAAWVAIPATADTSRVGIYATVTGTATANMGGHVGTTATPTLGITTFPLVFKPGITQFHGLSSASVLYVISLGAVTTDTICFQEVRQ